MKQKQQDEAYLVVQLLVDRSGSMVQYCDYTKEQEANWRRSYGDDWKKQTMNGGKNYGMVTQALNELIAALQAAFMPPRLAISAFSTGTPQILLEDRPISEVPEIQPGTFTVGGGTSTSSAIIHTLNRMASVKAQQKMLVILTDGDDGEYYKPAAQQAIKDALAKGMVIIVMATGVSPVEFARGFGIPKETAIQFNDNIPAAMRAVAHLCLRAGNGPPSFTDAERKEAKKPA